MAPRGGKTSNKKSAESKRPANSAQKSPATDSGTKAESDPQVKIDPVAPPVKKAARDRCPCLQPGEDDPGVYYKLVCTVEDCNQTWHTNCANWKGEEIPEQLLLSVDDWECPWCYQCPYPRPKNHAMTKKSKSLLTISMTNSICESVSTSLEMFLDKKLESK